MSTSADLIPLHRRHFSASPTRHIHSTESESYDTYELKSIPTSLENRHSVGLARPEDDDSDHVEEQEHQFLTIKDGVQSDGVVETHVRYTSGEERRVVKKFDRRLVLFIALLYMLSFLDRSNIGNARIAGMSQDLQLSSFQYEWLLTGFYITYILFEWMTLMYSLVQPHIYISICVFSWGLIASLQSVASSFTTLLVMRILLGVSEAAFGPGVPVYLSFFYKPSELAFRVGLFISAAPLATSFASSLAWVITMFARVLPVAPWRLLFLIEGFPSVAVAILVWYHIPDSPETARYLSNREKKVARLRLRPEQSDEHAVPKRTLQFAEILETLKDPKCYITAVMFFSCNVAFSSLPVFLPTILKSMGHTSLASQALSAPPYLLAFCGTLLTAYLSDRLRTRSTFICFHAMLGASGYLIIAISGWYQNNAWRYFGIFPACCGFFAAITIIITWTINNQETHSRKGTGVVMLNVLGQCGPLVGTRLYPDSDKPYFVRGMLVCAGFMFLVAILSLWLRFILAAKNRRMGPGYSAVGAKDPAEEIEDHREKVVEQFVYML